jgi:hypothetical protein
MSRYERVFTPTNRKQIMDDRKKTVLFSSDGTLHRRIVRKRKQTLEEEAEDKGWMLLK